MNKHVVVSAESNKHPPFMANPEIQTSPLAALIAKHEAAAIRFSEICSKEDEAGWAFTQAHKDDIYIGPFKSGWDMRHGEEWVQEQVALAIHRQSERLAAIAALNPELGDQVMRELRKTADDQKIKVSEAFAKVEQDKVACGLAAIKLEYETASEAERDALLDICSYRCVTTEDYSLRGEYLAQPDVLCSMDESYHEALIQSMTGGLQS